MVAHGDIDMSATTVADKSLATAGDELVEAMPERLLLNAPKRESEAKARKRSKKRSSSKKESKRSTKESRKSSRHRTAAMAVATEDPIMEIVKRDSLFDQGTVLMEKKEEMRSAKHSMKQNSVPTETGTDFFQGSIYDPTVPASQGIDRPRYIATNELNVDARHLTGDLEYSAKASPAVQPRHDTDLIAPPPLPIGYYGYEYPSYGFHHPSPSSIHNRPSAKGGSGSGGSIKPSQNEAVMQIDEESNQSTMHTNDKDSYKENAATLTEDIYSLLFLSKSCSTAFFFSIFVFFFQMAVIMLVLLDLLDLGSDNPLGVPPGVEVEVTIAQALALVLAVASQGDLLTAIILFHGGYDKRAKDTNPACTFAKWFISGLGQFLSGVSLLVVNFVQIVQSTTVIGMMLNFAALSFISEIDDIAFALAKHGFVLDSIEWQCKQVSEYEFPAARTKRGGKRFRRVMFLLIVAGMLGGWGYIFRLQRQGRYLPRSVFVQFSDAYNPFLAFFSGDYDAAPDELVNRRLVYLERRTDGNACFAYCEDESAWRFGECIRSVPLNLRQDPCQYEHWLYATSPVTTAYDITKAGSNWQVRAVDHTLTNYTATDLFYMSNNDCNSVADCNYYGHCQNNRCDCDDGRFGRHCEFYKPCPSITINRRGNLFPDGTQTNVQASDHYRLLESSPGEPVLVYEKPVYVNEDKNATGTLSFDIIMFLGRRWVMTNTDTFKDADWDGGNGVNFQLNKVVETLSTGSRRDFHGYYNAYQSWFVSTPMDVGTPTDMQSPIGLQWFQAKQTILQSRDVGVVVESYPLGASLLCSVCEKDTNDCVNGGTCSVDGSCNCSIPFVGALCEGIQNCADVGCPANYTCDDSSGRCERSGGRA